MSLDPVDRPLLELRGVSLDRGGRTVLREVHAHFGRSHVTAVVGPSGAGKSSLIRCLNRLEEPARGAVLYDGRDVRDLDPTQLRRRVGMIFQTPVLFEGGVRANLAYGLDHADEDRLVAALEAAGLPGGFIDRESAALSVGQAQRACIARALVREPEALLMDEPTSALDPKAAARIERLIRDLVAGGLTIVLVTHNLAQAERVADRAILIREGEVQMSAPPDEIARAWQDSSG